MRVLGAVLTGGQSSRFGSDKALAIWRGRALVEHAWDSVVAACDEAIMCGRSYFGHPSVPDQRWAGTGPLGGLSAALRFAVERDFDRVVTVPCDMPDIPRDLLETLASASDALILDGAPVVGGWPANLSDQLEHFLCSDRRKAVRDWARLAGAGVLTGWAVRNINFPADLPALDD